MASCFTSNVSKRLLGVLLLLCMQLVSAGKVPAVIVFGDSSVDAGNNNVISTVLKSNFRPYGRDFYGGTPTGRFSNGRVASDFISEAFGLKPAIPAYLDPAYGIEEFATGVCFASAGTGYDNDTSNVLSVIPLWKEVEYFADYRRKLIAHLGRQKAIETLNEALYIASIGTNDFLENYYMNTGRSRQFTIEQFEDFVIGLAEEFLEKIYHIGARKISLTSLIPMGCLPLERSRNFNQGQGCNEKYNDVAKSYNVKLQALCDKVNARLPGFEAVYTPIYDLLLSIIQSPSSYGYENVEVGCCASGMFEMGYGCNQWNPFTCEDADKYVFWDAFHPSQKTTRILALHAVKTSLAQFM